MSSEERSLVTTDRPHTLTTLPMDVLPDSRGHFGLFGGKYVPETLMSPLEELEQAYREGEGWRELLRRLPASGLFPDDRDLLLRLTGPRIDER